MKISNNIPAIQSYNALSANNSALQKSIRRLSTGLRINSAADDAAGLAISEKMRAQTRGLDVAVRNTQDGISMLQTAEGALNETHSILQRMRELSVQAANDTLTQEDRQYIQLEIDQLKEEITRIATTTQFNRKKLLDGSAAALWSSSDLTTKAYVRGSLRQTDQFGQKSTIEGNFNIILNASPGRAEVQKSDIFRIKHKDVIHHLQLNHSVIDGVRANNIPPGLYEITEETLGPTEIEEVWEDFRGTEDIRGIRFDITNPAVATDIEVKLKVISVDEASQSVKFEVTTAGTNFTPREPFIIDVYNASQSVVLGTKVNTAGETINVTADFGLNGVDPDNFREGFTLTYNNVRRITNQLVQTGSSLLDPGFSISSFTSPSTYDIENPLRNEGRFTITYTGRTGDGIGTNPADPYVYYFSVTGTTGCFDDITPIPYIFSWSELDPNPHIETLSNGFGITLNFDRAILDDNLSTPTTATFNLRTQVGSGELDTHTFTKPPDFPVTYENRASILLLVDNLEHEAHVMIKVRDKNEAANTLTVDITVTTTDGRTDIIENVALFAGGVLDIPILGTITYGRGSSSAAYYAVGDEMVWFIGSPARTTMFDFYSKEKSELDKLIFFEAAKKDTSVNASLLMEVVSVADNFVTFDVRSSVLSTDGKTASYVSTLTFNRETQKFSADESELGFGFNCQLMPGADTSGIKVGDKVVYNVTASSVKSNTIIRIDSEIGGEEKEALRFALDDEAIPDSEVRFRTYYLDPIFGTVRDGSISVDFGKTFLSLGKAFPDMLVTERWLASFEMSYIGQVAAYDVQLRDIDKYWDAQGVFMLADPKTITITQGDGKKTSVTLYGADTMSDVQKKLNDAIAYGLGQVHYLVDSAANFVSFVCNREEDGEEGTHESVSGTFVIRSAIAGSAGRLSFSGDEDLIKALSLNTIQTAADNIFNVSVYDAHNGSTVAANQKISGNLIAGIIHPNLDVEFDPMANVKVEWNAAKRGFDFKTDSTPYITTLHLAQNNTIMQIGANQGEDLALSFGNMSAEALGISRISVTDRESAGRAITIIDNALKKVSTQRAMIGAYQNRLEHAAANLTAAGTNLVAAESRIRDADMSRETMSFTRLNIISQAATAMLGQANLMPQSVLGLFG